MSRRTGSPVVLSVRARLLAFAAVVAACFGLGFAAGAVPGDGDAPPARPPALDHGGAHR